MLPCQLHLSCRKSDPRLSITHSASVPMQTALSSLCIPLTARTLQGKHTVAWTYLARSMSRSSEEDADQKTGKESWIPHARELCSSEKMGTQCRTFVAGMYLQGKTCIWPRFLREEGLLKEPQQLWTLS